MAICSTCKRESRRVRSRWDDKGAQLPDECPLCAPESFEKFVAPSDKKIWMGYEAHPNEYEKKYDSDGLIYVRKPEYRTEQENRLKSETEEEKASRTNAETKKRATRRKRPLDEEELHAATIKARMVAEWIESSAQQGIDVN